MLKYLVFVALFLGLAGCAVQTDQSPKASNSRFLAAIRDRLSQARQMERLGEASVVLESKDRAAASIDDNLRKNSGTYSLDERSLAYEKLGLLPPGGDLKQGLLSFYSSQAMAFYDSVGKRVVLAAGDDNGSERGVLREDDERVIAHELVHAYQDQRFAIGERLRAHGNGDAVLALRSVAEGDALLGEYAYVFGGVDDRLLDYVGQVLDATGGNPSLPSVPTIVSDRIQFQYVSGSRFVSRALRHGGWLSVNRLYQSPPLSTEQILHPEKYFEVWDPPARIELKNLSRLFPSPWREIENDTLGELSVRCLFSQFIETSAAASAAQGWGGDRFVAYQKGDNVAFIWATIWDSDADADEFHQEYLRVLAMKYGPGPSRSDYYVERRGSMVLVVEGLERQEISQHIDTVWAEMVVEKEAAQAPAYFAASAGR